MNMNVAIDHPAFIMWDGKTAYPRSVAGYVSFGFSIEVTDDITTDAVFLFTSAPASEADPCTPGTFTPVNKVIPCANASDANELEKITIPAGTKKGSVATGTIPCTPEKFISLSSFDGDTANVRIVLVGYGQGA